MSNTAQMSARERIDALLDDGSFVEIGKAVTKRSTDFNLQDKAAPSDGVITGYGVVNDNLVYVFSQDASVLAGTIGEMHAKKIARLYDLAAKTGAPVVGLYDCAGLRLEESYDALDAFGSIYTKQASVSGVVPQIAGVFGTCAGGVAVCAAMSDFTFMTRDHSRLFVNSPNALAGNYTAKLDTSSAAFRAENGGADVVCEDEAALLASIRTLLGVLPNNNEDDESYDECSDDLNRSLPAFAGEIQDPAAALADLSDDYFFFETGKDYAPEMVTGFIRLNGMTVGAAGNREAFLDGKDKVDAGLSAHGCEKAAAFVRFCDAFNIPVLTLTNVAGFQQTLCSEKSIARAAAKLTYAFTDATVPKVNVITGKAFGSAYITMNSRHIGADMVFALPTAKIGMMDAKLAAGIMYDGSAADVIAAKAAEYEALQGTADAAAKRGYVDAVIAPEEVRAQVIYAFETLFTKRENRPERKHGTV